MCTGNQSEPAALVGGTRATHCANPRAGVLRPRACALMRGSNRRREHPQCSQRPLSRGMATNAPRYPVPPSSVPTWYTSTWSGGTLHVRIVGEIGTYNTGCQPPITAIAEVRNVQLFLWSRGGCSRNAFKIRNVLKGKRVSARIKIAMSARGPLALAAERREIEPSGVFKLHPARSAVVETADGLRLVRRRHLGLARWRTLIGLLCKMAF